MNIDEFLDRKYNLREYNCGHYVAEVYEALTGENIREICAAFNNEFRGKFAIMLKERTKLKYPVEPCVVIMRRIDTLPHAGIYVNQRILHLTDRGPTLDHPDIAKSLYDLSYYK